MNNLLKMCMNWKVLAGVVAVVIVLFTLVPGFIAILPLLLFLAVCPLMMFLMMRGMMGMTQSGSAPAPPVQPGQTTDNMVTGNGIAELKAEQERINHQIAALEARQILMPSDSAQDAPVTAYSPRR